MQIEGTHCHHGADELIGRCAALHQPCREEGQASGYAQVRWVAIESCRCHGLVSIKGFLLYRREYQPLGRYTHGRASLFLPPVRPRFGGERPGVEQAPARELVLLLVSCTLVGLGTKTTSHLNFGQHNFWGLDLAPTGHRNNDLI